MLCGPRSTSMRARPSPVRSAKLNAPASPWLMGTPSMSTCVCWLSNPRMNTLVSWPGAPVWATATPGTSRNASATRSVWRSAISSAGMTVTSAGDSSSATGRRVAVTTTRSASVSVPWRGWSSVEPGETGDDCCARTGGGNAGGAQARAEHGTNRDCHRPTGRFFMGTLTFLFLRKKFGRTDPHTRRPGVSANRASVLTPSLWRDKNPRAFLPPSPLQTDRDWRGRSPGPGVRCILTNPARHSLGGRR